MYSKYLDDVKEAGQKRKGTGGMGREREGWEGNGREWDQQSKWWTWEKRHKRPSHARTHTHTHTHTSHGRVIIPVYLLDFVSCMHAHSKARESRREKQKAPEHHLEQR